MQDYRKRDENSTIKIKALVEGAILSAIATILAIIGLFLPPLSLITNFLWIIPIIVICLRHDMRVGLLVLLVSTVLIMMFGTPFSGLALVLEYGLMGLIYGFAFRKKLSVGKTLFYGCLAAVLGTILVIFLSFMLTGFSPDYLQTQAQEAMDAVLEMYEQMGFLENLAERGLSEAQIQSMMQGLLTVVISLIPGFMVVSSLSSAFLSFFLSRIILKKMHISLPSIPPFQTWRIPWYYIWGFIVAFGLFLLGDYTRWKVLKIIGQNVMLVYGPIFFVIGMAILKFYLDKFKVAKGFRFLIILMTFMYFPFAFIFISSLGIFDTLFDYRRLTGGKKI
ncbi:MAG: YybS family protein [Zhaonellaceae bacterium]|nr:YybS family protein [Clostridia bacterium]